jgi:hypothetical protein
MNKHGPLCPRCGHPTVSHGIAGCLDNQWHDLASSDFCLCDLTEDEAVALLAQAP